jgi:hypothetical protein
MPTIEVSRKRAVDEKLQAHRISDSEYIVYNTVKKTQYSVTKSVSGNWHCTCPFMTKGSHVGTSGVCKHLTRVFDKLRGCGRGTCREGKLCASCSFEERMLG